MSVRASPPREYIKVEDCEWSHEMGHRVSFNIAEDFLKDSRWVDRPPKSMDHLTSSGFWSQVASTLKARRRLKSCRMSRMNLLHHIFSEGHFRAFPLMDAVILESWIAHRTLLESWFPHPACLFCPSWAHCRSYQRLTCLCLTRCVSKQWMY